MNRPAKREQRFLRLLLAALLVALAAGVSLAQTASFFERLAAAALKRTKHHVTYDGRYRKIDYPNGDVPADIGVCTDLVIRAYRAVGIDLQKEVHEDMKAHFDKYPKHWGHKKADPNIDHRRVPNLRLFFSRKGKGLPVSYMAKDYRPGDLVTWNIANTKHEPLEGGGYIPHIGIVSTRFSKDKKRPLVVHNIGLGPKEEDILFAYEITGHYQFKKTAGE